MNTTAKGFRGELGFCSNFHPVEIEKDGIVYPSVEHAYQAAKFLNTETRKLIAKHPGRGLKSFVRGLDKSLHPMNVLTDTKKVSIMQDLLVIKFKNPAMAVKLKTTSGALVEYNYWHDNFWGHCLCDKCKDIDHLNIMGFTLEVLRTRIKSGGLT